MSPPPPPQASRSQRFLALVEGNEGDESDTDYSANDIDIGDSDDEVYT